MQQPVLTRKQLTILIIVLVFFIGVIIAVSIFLQGPPKNQFGNLIRIQNYDEKIKNLSPDMKDSMESYLYTVVKGNTDEGYDVSGIKDAFIRESSDSQNYNPQTDIYSGEFIIDIASIKQSYRAQYSYSNNQDNVNIGGNPVVISCLPEDQLKYGKFDCKDLVSDQASKGDVILQYLPYQNFTFKISPDKTQGDTLVLNTTLTIPDSDLRGDVATNQQVVAMYKKEVTDWIASKGENPSDYTIVYNYDDNGNYIEPALPTSLE
jgi:hypothetical protein